MYNPAQRFATILADFDRFSETFPNPYDNWRAALRLSQYAESQTVHICVVRVLQLPDDIRHTILCAPESPPRRFQTTLNELRHYLLRFGFHERFDIRQRRFPRNAYDHLETIAAEYAHEVSAPEAMEKFLREAAELHALILSHEGVDPDAKQCLCEFLQMIMYALEHYNVSGARGVVTALDLALGAMSRYAPVVRATPAQVQHDLYDLLNRLDRFMSPLNAHDPHVGATLKLLGFDPRPLPPPKKAA